MADNTIALSLTSAAAQPRQADVVIVGGGVIGVSIAWHLASKGVKNIVVIDRFEFGMGSSAKPLGGVRANFTDPANIVLGQRSLEKFRGFRQDFGVDIGLQKVGYLFLARSADEAAGLENSTAVQNELGVASRMIDPQEAVRMNPYLQGEALVAGSFSPDDGFARPSQVVAGYMAAAQDLGATFLNYTEVVGIETRDGRIDTVTTTRGEIQTATVICCAGAWSQSVAAMVGIEMPIRPVRRMIGFTPQRSGGHPVVPFTLDLSTTLYFHNSGNGLLLGISHGQDSCFCREYSAEWLADFNAAAAVVCPGLERPEIVEGWAGLYEYTPDNNAYIGRSETVDGFFYAAGFSGHGFLQSPAVGDYVSDLYLDRPSFLDSGHFNLDRFARTDDRALELNII